MSSSINDHYYTTASSSFPSTVESSSYGGSHQQPSVDYSQQQLQQQPMSNDIQQQQQQQQQQKQQPQNPIFFIANGQPQGGTPPSPPTPDTPPLSQHGSHHNLHRNGSSGDLNLHKLQRSGSTAALKSIDTCRVCGDSPARPHYGVPTCFGCKGFFRRTLKRTKEYTCRYNGNCVVDRYERNSCRYCRFKRCLDVGMDPKAVRPDRDAAGRSHPIRHRRSRVSLGELNNLEDEDPTDEWVRKLPVDMRTLLMQIMNIDLMVNSGDTHADPMSLYPLQIGSLRHILEDPTSLDGKRAEMSYEPYRRVKGEEMVAVAHRRLIAVIDMVDHLCVLMDINNVQDKLALVKSAYAPLALFCTVAATARTTKDRDIFCLCCCGYIARGMSAQNYEESYHFTNRIVERALDELVEPFRAFNFKDQEIALMKAIVTLNPHIRSLSTEAAEQVADMRDRIQETLYNVVRESHPKEVASSRFGNLLLFLPNIMLLGQHMYENFQFLHSFGHRKVDPLLAELLDNLEPIQGPDDISSFGSNERVDSMMRSSMSNSSLSSMDSHSSYRHANNNTSSSSNNNDNNSSNNTNQQQQMMNEDYYSRRQSADSCLPLSTSAPTSMSSTSFPTNGLPQQDSDPDYNTTLTAENFSGMRQAIVQSMEIDGTQMSDFYNQQPPQNGIPQSIPSSSSQQQQHQKPRFYIDSYQQQPQAQIPHVHTTIGSRHIFTVEATKDPNFINNSSTSSTLTAGLHQQHAGVQHQHQTLFQNPAALYQQQQGGLEMNAPPPSLSKSQSFPYFTQFAQQQTSSAYNPNQQLQFNGGQEYGGGGR